ncbi:MAG: putative S-layer protein, partial [Nanoarchaeota archaeon]
MTNKIFTLFALSVFVFAFLVAGVNAATLSTWALTTNATAAANVNVVASALTVGTGLNTGVLSFGLNGATANTGTTLADGWGETTLALAVTGNDYYQVTLTPNLGVNTVITSISFSHITNDATTMDFAVRTSEDTFASNISAGTVALTSGTATISNLKLAVGASETITLRIYGFNALATNTFSIANLVVSGDFVPVEVIACVTTGNAAGNMVVDSIDLAVDEGYGSDEEWFPFDDVNFESNVEYNSDDANKLDNIDMTWILFNSVTFNSVMDGDDSISDLDGGEDADVLVQLTLDEDVEDTLDSDVLYMIVEADDEETGLAVCAYKTASVSMQSEDTLIFDNTQYPTTALQCGDEVLVTADIWNIGDDQEATYITVTNTELGINNQRIELGDVDSFEDASLDFTMTIPADAAEKSYNLIFSIYDEDDDVFEIADDEAELIVPISVSGGCAGTSSSATVSANLVSGGKSGESLVVKTTITNTGSKAANYTLNAAGYAAWADTATLSETTFSLNAGQSKDVTITLATKSGVSGKQTFNVEAVSGSQTAIQPVQVVLENPGFLSGITGGAIGG